MERSLMTPGVALGEISDPNLPDLDHILPPGPTVDVRTRSALEDVLRARNSGSGGDTRGANIAEDGAGLPTLPPPPPPPPPPPSLTRPAPPPQQEREQQEQRRLAAQHAIQQRVLATEQREAERQLQEAARKVCVCLYSCVCCVFTYTTLLVVDCRGGDRAHVGSRAPAT